ncbi:MAG: hypothetical protein L0322_26160, partial [Chloroflexi bacterium]|nr:hypothetical protein [Chloroflexota bacterium]
MKVTCNQADLAKGLGLVGRAAGQRASLPILSHALLATTQDGRLQLAATNLEISICCWISSQVEAGGAAAVPRSLTAALSPAIAGWLLSASPFGWPLV